MPELLETAQDILDADEAETLDIEFFLDDLNNCGFILVLMLDEFEWVVRTDPENEAATRNFLGSLRSLINHVPRARSLIVTILLTDIEDTQDTIEALQIEIAVNE